MIRTKLQLARFDKDGQLAEQREQWSKSWLKHFFDILYIVHQKGVSLAGVNDISGAPRLIANHATVSESEFALCSPPGAGVINALYGNTTEATTPIAGHNAGIIVGTNNGAVTPTQDALIAKITHGEGAGQLLYGGTELYGLTFADPDGQFTIRRYFTNVLGGAISVVESGIYAVATLGSADFYSFCIARDIFGAVVVNNGEILRVTYVVQITT